MTALDLWKRHPQHLCRVPAMQRAFEALRALSPIPQTAGQVAAVIGVPESAETVRLRLEPLAANGCAPGPSALVTPAKPLLSNPDPNLEPIS